MNYAYTSLGTAQGQRWRSRIRLPFQLPFILPRHALKIIIAVAAFAFITFYWLYEIHIELAFYPRSWVSQEILSVRPLSGCFEPERIARTDYNLTRARAPKHNEVHAGMNLPFGRDCYNFAGTIQPVSQQHRDNADDDELTIFHSYWRTDLAPFGPRQEWLLKSFFATQDLSRVRLILWSNGDLSAPSSSNHPNPITYWTSRYPASFETRQVDLQTLARGTALDGSDLLKVKDEKAWIDGDVVRLLVLWAYGGVWIDMDSLLTRDMTPLLEHEFVTQWDCYDKLYQPLNGAAMSFYKHSPYLCEAFSLMASSPPPRQGSTDWGSLLYHKLFRGLLAGGIPPFKILPFCFTDGRSCRLDTRLPDPFAADKDIRGGGGSGSVWGAGGAKEGGTLDQALKNVFAVHLHNQWEKEFPAGGWVERLLLRRYDERLGLDSRESEKRREGDVDRKVFAKDNA